MTAQTCAACTKPWNPGDRFCHYCGAPAGTAVPRKQSGETELLVALPVTKQAEPKGAPIHPARPPRAWRAIGGIVAFLGAGGGAWWWVSRGTSAPPPPVVEQPPPAPVPRSAASAPTPPLATGPSRLILTGVPFGATITVDGRRRSGASFELEPGTHEIRVTASGYEATVDTVTLRPGQRTEFQVTVRPSR